MLIQPHTMHLFHASAYQEPHNHKYQRYLSFMLRNLICKQKLTENFKYLGLESENLSPTFTMRLGRTKVFRLECHLTPPVNSVTQQQLAQSVSNSKRLFNKWRVWGFVVIVLPRLPGRFVLVPSCSPESCPALSLSLPPRCPAQDPAGRRLRGAPQLPGSGSGWGSLPVRQSRSTAGAQPPLIRCFASLCKRSCSPCSPPSSNPENSEHFSKNSFPHF